MFHVLIFHLYVHSSEVFLHLFGSFLIELFLFTFSFESLLYILERVFLSDVIYRYFFQVACLFILLTGSFMVKVFNFDEIVFSSFTFIDCILRSSQRTVGLALKLKD